MLIISQDRKLAINFGEGMCIKMAEGHYHKEEKPPFYTVECFGIMQDECCFTLAKYLTPEQCSEECTKLLAAIVKKNSSFEMAQEKGDE